MSYLMNKKYYLVLIPLTLCRYMLMSPSIQQMRSYTWLKRHLPGSVVLQVSSCRWFT